MSEFKNRRVFHEYFIDATYEAGMVLHGTEVKAMRIGRVTFNDAYCQIHQGEIFLKSLHIGEYTQANINNHAATRDRKLLLHKREITKIAGKLKEKGYSLVPIRIFMTKENLYKIEIGLAKGKKLYDKRETLKSKDVERDMKRYMK